MSALEKVRKGIPRTTSHADVSQQESLLDNQTIPSLSEARNLLWPSFRSPGLSRQSFKGRRWYFFSFRYFFSEVSALSVVHEECTAFECGYKSDFRTCLGPLREGKRLALRVEGRCFFPPSDAFIKVSALSGVREECDGSSSTGA